MDLKTVEKSGSCERKRSHFGQAQFGNNGTIKKIQGGTFGPQKIYEPYGASEEPAIAAREGTLKHLHLPVQSPDERGAKNLDKARDTSEADQKIVEKSVFVNENRTQFKQAITSKYLQKAKAVTGYGSSFVHLLN